VIDFPDQLAAFHTHKAKAVDLILSMLIDSDTRNRILQMASRRHAEGFKDFGDRMFTWDARERRQNVYEELADAIVYLTSGEV
jgi:hypothetical protein